MQIGCFVGSVSEAASGGECGGAKDVACVPNAVACCSVVNYNCDTPFHNSFLLPGAELAHTSGSSRLAATEQDLVEVLSSMVVSASGQLEVCFEKAGCLTHSTCAD